MPSIPRRILLALAFTACGGPAEPQGPSPLDALPDADLRILWVGNSLTYTHDLPELVRDLGEADGRSVAYATFVAPDLSLEDQWRRGVEAVIRERAADVVVLQQGPSSLPESQAHLREWSERLAVAIRRAGGVPALYMVWPPLSRLHAFDDVATSYAAAAAAVDGVLLPAGDAWRRAWARDAELPLYGSDGFHPAPLGTLLAGLTIYGTLARDGGEPPPCPVAAVATVEPGLGELLCAAAREAIEASSRGGLPGPR